MRRHSFMNITIALFVTLSLSSVAFAQAKFDARDLTGVWQREGDRGVNPKVPEMTPEGLKKFNDNKPSYGRPLGAPLNGEHIGRVRAVPPAQGNSLVGDCNPPGVPTALLRTRAGGIHSSARPHASILFLDAGFARSLDGWPEVSRRCRCTDADVVRLQHRSLGRR